MIPNSDYPILTGDSEFLAILAPACRESSIIARSISPDESEINATTDDLVKVKFVIVADAYHGLSVRR